MKNVIILFAVLVLLSCERKHYYVCAYEVYHFAISEFGDTAEPVKYQQSKVLTKLTHDEAAAKTTEFSMNCKTIYESSIYYYHDKEIRSCDSSRYVCWQP